MKNTILSVLALALCFTALSCAPSNIAKEDQLLGEWKTGAGSTMEAFTFATDKSGRHSYLAVRQGRITESGTWEIRDGKLNLSLNNGKTRSYSEFRLEKGSLILDTEKFDAAGGQKMEGRPETEKQSQAEPSDLRVSGLKELLLNCRSSTGIAFGEPRRSNFTWSISDGGDIPVSGFEIGAKIAVNGDFADIKEKANEAARYFYSIGFDGDAANTTEITIGEKKGRLVCVIELPWTDNSEPEGSFPLKVRCGYLK